jgi:hypothetical protein
VSARPLAPALGMAALLAFLAAVTAQHVLRPDFDPLRHQVSEYAHGRYGWLMTAGFCSWAVSVAATARASGTAVRWMLAIAAASILVVATFETQTIAGELPPGTARSSEGRLHDAGAALATLALLMGAVTSAVQARTTPRYRWCAVLLVGAALTANSVLLVVGDGVGGLRQRVVLAIGCVWQMLWLLERRP